jgi:hypothetical protein
MAEIEKRLARVEEVAKKAGALLGTADGDFAQALEDGEGMLPAPAMAYYGNVDAAAKALDLTAGQKAEFDRIVAETKREHETLRKIPDETGKTWEDVGRETFHIGEGGVFHLDLSKAQAFREKVIPGRNESFGQADRRIAEGAKRRLRDTLGADQQKTFDGANTDALTGGGGGGGFGNVMFSVSEVDRPK